MKQITVGTIQDLRSQGMAQRVRKTAYSWGKVATRQDVDKGYVSAGMDILPTPGIINTLEGPKEFFVGNVIVRGVKGEFWPMTLEAFNKIKIQSGEDRDVDGFYTYRNRNTCLAIQMQVDFVITYGYCKDLTQKAGAYLLFNEDNDECWPLAEELFPDTYTSA